MAIRDAKRQTKSRKSGQDFLSVLARLSSLALSPTRPEQVISETLRDIRRAYRARCSWLFLTGDGKVRLGGYDCARGTQGGVSAELLEKLSPQALKRVCPIACNHPGKLYRDNRALYQLLHAADVHKLLGVPLKSDGKLIGVLSVGRSPSSPDFTREDLRSLTQLGTVIVLSKLKQAEIQSARSGEFLEAIIDNIPNPIFIKDRRHRLLVLNKAATELTGYSREEVLGKSDHDFFPREQADSFWKTDEEMFRTGKVIDIPDESFTDREGNLHYVHTKKAPLRNASGKVTHVVGVIEDITHRKRVEKDIIGRERIVRERARLLADLRKLEDVEQILTRVCEAVRDSGLFQRAVMTLHRPGGKICHLGQVGLPASVVKRARRAPPVDRKMKAKLTSQRFRISDSFFIPAEAGLILSKSGRYIPQKKTDVTGGDWRVGDELFVPLLDFSGRTMGYLSVDTPTDGCRPDLKKIQALETLVAAASSRVREIEVHQALRDERDFSRSIFDAANSMIICLDAEAKITMFNRECERVTGYRRKEVLGKRWPDLFLPPDKRHDGLKSFADWVRAHPRDQYEGPILTKRGIRTILWSNTSVIGSDENDVTAIAIGHDITERKKTEEALRSSEQTARALLNASPDIALLIDPDGTIVALSEATARILGKDASELIGTCAFDLFEPEISARRRAVTKKAIRSGQPVRFEDERGTMCWDSNVYPIFDERGKVVRLAVFAYEITERRRTERALRENESRYRVLFEDSPVSLWEEDFSEVKSYIDALRDSGIRNFRAYFQRHPRAVLKCASLVKVIDVNKASLRLYGARNKEELISDFGKILARESYAPFREELISIAEGKTVFEGKAITLDLRGKKKHVMVRWTVAPGYEQSLSKVLVTVVDVTEREMAEQKVQQERRRLFSVLDTMPAFVYLQAPDYSVPFVNRTFRELFGDPGDLPCYQAFYGRSKPCDPCITMGVLGSKTPQTYEWTSKDGRTYVVQDHPLAGIDGTDMVLGTGIDITERKQAEKALRDSEETARALLNAPPGVALLADPDGTIVALSESTAKTLGKRVEELTGASVFDLFPSEVADRRRKEGSKVIRSGKPLRFEDQREGRWFDQSIYPVFSAQGKVARLAIFAHDITERKQAEQTLQESERLYRTTIDSVDDPMHVVDTKLRFITVNEAFKRWTQRLGFRTDVIGRKILDTFKFLPKKVGDEYRMVLRTGKTLVSIESNTLKGMEFVTETHKIPVVENGEVVRIITFLRDVTERKRAEQALRESEQRFKAIFDHARDGIVLADPQSKRFYTANKTMCRMLGYSLQEISSLGVSDIHTEEDLPYVLKQFDRQWKREITLAPDVPVRRKDGSTFYADVNSSRITLAEKTYLMGIFRDVTQRKQAEEQYRTLVETAQEGIGICDPKENLVFVNQALADLLGYKREELIGADLKDLSEESQFSVFKKETAKRRKGGASKYEATLLTKSGKPKPVYVSAAPLWNDDGSFKGTLGVLSDLTEIKKVREYNILLNTSRSLSRSLKFDQVLKLGAEKMIQALNADRCSVMLAEDGTSGTAVKVPVFAFGRKKADSRPVWELRTTGEQLSSYEQSLRARTHIQVSTSRTDPAPELAKRIIRKAGMTSALAVPIFQRNRLMGVLHVGMVGESRAFDPEQVRLALTMANQVGAALQNCRLMEDLKGEHSRIIEQAKLLKAQFREQKMMFELTQTLTSARNLDQLLKSATRKVVEILGTERSSVALVNPDGVSTTIRALYPQAAPTDPKVVGVTFKPDVFPQVKQILVHKKPLIFPDISKLPKTDIARKYFSRRGLKSTMAVPLISRGKVLGFLTVGTVKEVHPYTKDEIRLLRTVSNAVGVAVENYQLLEDLKQKYLQIEEQATTLRKQTREKDILLKVSQALSRNMDLDELSQVASRVVGTELGAERCGVSLPTPDGSEIEIRGLFQRHPTGTRRLTGTRFSWQDFPDWTKIIKKGKPWVISKTSDLPTGSKTSRYFTSEGIRSVLGTGMFFGKKLVGVLSITSVKEHRAFSQEEIKLIQTLGNQIAVAIENSRLFEMVSKHTQDLRDLSAQLMEVQEDERKRIAQELHDMVGQMLQSMKMNLDRMRKNLSLKPQKLEGMMDWLLDTEELLGQTIDDIRTLTFELRPSMLDDFGLIPTLRWYIDNYSKRSNIKVVLKTKDRSYRFPLDVEVALYRIVQEALTNVAKHAQATEASVMVAQKDSTVILSVKDNGAGFDADKVLSTPRGEMGLFNIRERVNLLGGKFEIISRPRKGTTLNINIPSSEVKHEED